MELRKLIADLPGKKNSAYTFERGKTIRHPFANLASDVALARKSLTAWGVKAGMRVGIFAPNSYHWLVHDLALIDVGAISVAFTDDFAGRINEETLTPCSSRSQFCVRHCRPPNTPVGP